MGGISEASYYRPALSRQPFPMNQTLQGFSLESPEKFVPRSPRALCLWNPYPQSLKPDFLGVSSEAQVKFSQSLGTRYSLISGTPRGPTLPPAMPS